MLSHVALGASRTLLRPTISCIFFHRTKIMYTAHTTTSHFTTLSIFAPYPPFGRTFARISFCLRHFSSSLLSVSSQASPFLSSLSLSLFVFFIVETPSPLISYLELPLIFSLLLILHTHISLLSPHLPYSSVHP